MAPNTTKSGSTFKSAGASVPVGMEHIPEPNVRKHITCPRCKGDGIWHTTATGHRLKTIGGPTVDPTRTCPKCKSKGKVIVWVKKSVFEAEKAANISQRNAAKKKIDDEAKRAKAEVDKR